MSSLTAIGTPSSGALPAGSPPRVGLVGLQQRALAEHHAKGVQRGSSRSIRSQVQLDELARGDLAGGDQLGLAGDPGEGELDGVHRMRNLLNSARQSRR